MLDVLAGTCGTAIAVQEGPSSPGLVPFLCEAPLIRAAGKLRKAVSETDLLLGDVLRALRGKRKWLSCKYFYDGRGSELFEQSCPLPEYYLTRTDLAIMRENASAMADCIGANAVIVELGSG